jgi:hypothetical protein
MLVASTPPRIGRMSAEAIEITARIEACATGGGAVWFSGAALGAFAMGPSLPRRRPRCPVGVRTLRAEKLRDSSSEANARWGSL